MAVSEIGFSNFINRSRTCPIAGTRSYRRLGLQEILEDIQVTFNFAEL